MHIKDARVAGEMEQRLYVLPAWREAPFYSEHEHAALEMHLLENQTHPTASRQPAAHHLCKTLRSGSRLRAAIFTRYEVAQHDKRSTGPYSNTHN